MDPAGFMAQLRKEEPSVGDSVEKLYGVGFWLYSQERYADAALAFRTLLRAAPSDERGWLALGACHEKIEQPRIALELYAWGAEAAPGSVRCHLARARLLARLERDSDAVAAVATALNVAEETRDEELIRLVQTEGKRHVAQH
ncbi:MAG TPA: hypothetical protein VJV79_31605 [Polyangiaceae bacterium]|nr:hypothetical protein [Polyangiaceae bacterium]